MKSLYPRSHWYHLDSKPDFSIGFETMPGFISSMTAPDSKKLVKGSQVWRLPGYDDVAEYAKWLDDIYTNAEYDKNDPKRIETFIHINELASLAIGQSGRTYPNILAKLLKMGRTKGITMVIEGQELYYIPRQVPGQSTHFLQLRIGNLSDAEKIMKHLGSSLKLGSPRNKHGMFYKNITDSLAPIVEYDSYKDFFGLE